MTDFGKIKSYDSGTGTGTITPEKGGDALPFRKADMQQEGQEPKQDGWFGYDVQSGDDGRRSAVNLHPRQQTQDQNPQERSDHQQS